jgi:hypothetical protein
MTARTDLTCVHADQGLCPACQAEYEEDPQAWIEFGDHPAGLARWKPVQDAMDREAEDLARDGLLPPSDDTIPF